MYVKSFRDLEDYKRARELSGVIAEAWGKRRYEKQFISKLTDADGEQLETQHWIETAVDCSYISEEVADDLLKQCATISKMLSSRMNKSESFCNNIVNEAPSTDC